MSLTDRASRLRPARSVLKIGLLSLGILLATSIAQAAEINTCDGLEDLGQTYISGIVTGSEDLSTFTVEFSGAVTGGASVQSDGSFEMTTGLISGSCEAQLKDDNDDPVGEPYFFFMF